MPELYTWFFQMLCQKFKYFMLKHVIQLVTSTLYLLYHSIIFCVQYSDTLILMLLFRLPLCFLHNRLLSPYILDIITKWNLHTRHWLIEATLIYVVGLIFVRVAVLSGASIPVLSQVIELTDIFIFMMHWWISPNQITCCKSRFADISCLAASFFSYIS